MEGKSAWISFLRSDYGVETSGPNMDVVDLYGSESARFVLLYGYDWMSSNKEGECTRSGCRYTSRGRFAGDIILRSDADIKGMPTQEQMKLMWHDCLHPAADDCRPCGGQSHWGMRTFFINAACTLQGPPVIILRIHDVDLPNTSIRHPQDLPESLTLPMPDLLQVLEYRLHAVTFCNSSPFCCILRRGGSWYHYDGYVENGMGAAMSRGGDQPGRCPNGYLSIS